MIGSDGCELSPAEDVVNDELRARRELFLAESAANYDVDPVDATEIEELLAEARRHR